MSLSRKSPEIRNKVSKARAAGKPSARVPSAGKPAPGRHQKTRTRSGRIPSWALLTGLLVAISMLMALTGIKNPVSLVGDVFSKKGFHPFESPYAPVRNGTAVPVPNAEEPAPDALDRLFRFAAESADLRRRETGANDAGRPGQIHLLVIGYQRVVSRNFLDRRGLFTMVETEDGLRRTIKGLKIRGYSPITFEKWHRHVVSGESLPERPVVLAFNDGYEEHFERVLPILRQEGFTASFFIPTSLVGTKAEGITHMNWREIQALAAAGMEICSHSATHETMDSMEENKIGVEMAESRKALKDNCGIDAGFFSHPWGRQGKGGSNLAKAMGYHGTVVTEPGRTEPNRKRYMKFYPGRERDQSVSASSLGPKPKKSS